MTIDQLRSAVSASWITGTPDFRRLYDKELLALFDCTTFQGLYAAAVPAPANTQEMAGLAAEVWAMAQGRPISEACDAIERHLRAALPQSPRAASAGPVTKEYCAKYPGTAAYIIHAMALKIDAFNAAPPPVTAAQPSESPRAAEPVAIVDASDDGLFVEIVYGPDGSPLKIGDELYLAAPPAAQPDAKDAAHHGLDNARQVLFYEQDFYVLSNFSSFTLMWEGLRFDTSEAAYHWEKFASEDWNNPGCTVANDIMNAPSAHEAFKIAERNKALRRADWDDVKVDIMRKILRAKADQHEYVRRKLLATGDRELIENSWRDDYWGWGPNRDGKNMLGKLWMEVRAAIKGGAA